MSSITHDNVMELSGKLSAEITVTGTEATIDKAAYTKNLPEGLTAETIEAVQKYNSTFYPAVTHAFGEHAITTMKNSSEVNQLTLEVPLVGKDHYDITVNRSRTYRNPQDETTPVVKWGHVESQLVTHAIKAGRGEMSVIRDRLSAMALEALCK